MLTQVQSITKRTATIHLTFAYRFLNPGLLIIFLHLNIRSIIIIICVNRGKSCSPTFGYSSNEQKPIQFNPF
jgi:hypothetical protein